MSAEVKTDLDKAKIRSLRMLSRRTHSIYEIEKKLIEKGTSEEDARQTTLWLEELGYVNDADYAEAIARRYQSRGYGIARIKNELFRRGIDRELWDDALSSLEKTQNEDAAVGFLEKKLKGSNDKDDLRRALDALVRRGFSFDEAKSAVNRYLELILCHTLLD